MIRTLLHIFTGVNLLLYLYIIYSALKRWKYNTAIKYFAIFIIFSTCWIFIRLFENIAINNWGLLIKLDFSFAALVAGAAVLFSRHFPKGRDRLITVKELFSLIPILILVILPFSNIFFEIFSYKQIKYSNWYFLYIGVLILYFLIIGGGTFIRKFLRSKGIIRLQLAYILIGYYFALTILLYDSLYTATVEPRITNMDILFFNGSIIFSLFISYAILKYRFLDTRIIIRKGIIYGSALILLLAFYTYLALLLKTTIEESWQVNPGWTTIILIALVALGFPLLKKLIENLVNKIFKDKKSIDLAVKELQEKVVKETDFEKLIKIVNEQIRQYLNIKIVQLYVLNHQKHYLVYQDTDGLSREINANGDLLKYFNKYTDVLVGEEIPHLIEDRQGSFEREMLQKASKEMKKNKAGLAMPFKADDEIIGLLILGQKLKNQAYTVQDVQYLERLREQVGFTLANALLYKEAMERISAGAV